MGFASWLGMKAPVAAPNPVDPAHLFDPLGGSQNIVSIDFTSILGQTPAELWRTQPHLRTVVDFLGRNIAQLAVKPYRRASDQDRQSASDSIVAGVLRRPNAGMTAFELFRGLVSDLALWDRAYWLMGKDITGAWTIRPIPAAWVTGTYGGDLFAPAGFNVTPPSGRQISIPAEQVLHFHGWNPSSLVKSASPVETLRMILAEQIHAVTFRDQRWRNGGRVGSVLERPTGAPVWDEKDAKRFKEDWKSRYGADGTNAGGTPILEDGMTLKQVGFSAKEDEFVAASKLALTTVASVYHVNPTMIGVLDNANYSNVREFRRMLYGDTLGPIIAMIEDRLNSFLLPMIGEKPDIYVEFNIAEKLQGSFEEQAAVMSASVGGPWMTRNEARAKNNLPAIDGADELVVPLNVLIGGQASPQDSAPKAATTEQIAQINALVEQVGRLGAKAPGVKAGAARVKATPRDDHAEQTAAVLRKFFARQKSVVLSHLGAKSPDYWDESRWNEELADDLYALAMKVTREVSADVLDGLGLQPDQYNPKQTENFLRKVAEVRASMINDVTLRQIKEAVKDPEADPADVFDKAETSRADQAGTTLATTLAAFAATESVKQVAGDKATKTWVVQSSNPRPEHDAMDGETVAVGETFSNGAKYPGDWVLGVDGVAGCTCTTEMEVSQ